MSRSNRPVLENGAVDALRHELRWLGRELAAARDAEVLRTHFAAVTTDEPRLWRPAVRRGIRSALREEHRSGHQRAVTAVASERFQHLVRGVAAVVQAAPTSECGRSPAVEVLPRLLRQELRRVRRAARTVSAMSPGPERDVVLHEVRKKAKRTRYAAESATPVFGPRAVNLAKRAKKVQRALGDHQDSVEARAWLERFAREVGDDPLAAFAAGRLHAVEERRAAAAVNKYDDALRRVPTRHPRRWLRR